MDIKKADMITSGSAKLFVMNGSEEACIGNAIEFVSDALFFFISIYEEFYI